MQSNFRKGFFFSLIATVLLSTNYVTGKYALQGFNPWTFSVIWCSAAATYSLIIVLFTGGLKDLVLPKRAFRAMLYLGLVTAGAMLLSWWGLSMLDPAFYAFLFRFYPVLTILLAAIFLSEKLPRRLFAPAALMIAGGILSTVGRWHIVALGMCLTLVACCMAALTSLIVKIKVFEIRTNVMVFYRVFIAAVVVALVVLATGKADFNVAGKYWAVILLGAFLGPCLAHVLMFRSYAYWDLSLSSIVYTAQPLLVIPLAYAVLGRLPAGMELVGGLIILAGAFWLALAHRQDKPNRSQSP